jgi:hypothetical protein
MTNIINLADHRPPAPRRPSRLQRLTRHADSALCTIIVASGLCLIAWFPGAALVWLVSRTLAVPWYLDIFLKGAPAVLVGMWAARMFRDPGRAPHACSINVHVFEDEVARTCKCGATGDVDGDGAA